MRADFCEMHKNEMSKRRAKRVQDGATSRAGLTMPCALFTRQLSKPRRFAGTACAIYTCQHDEPRGFADAACAVYMAARRAVQFIAVTQRRTGFAASASSCVSATESVACGSCSVCVIGLRTGYVGGFQAGKRNSRASAPFRFQTFRPPSSRTAGGGLQSPQTPSLGSEPSAPCGR